MFPDAGVRTKGVDGEAEPKNEERLQTIYALHSA